MAASPALRVSAPTCISPEANSLQANNSAVQPQAARQSQVVRTPLHVTQTGSGSRSVRRRITPSDGFALQVLGHAIEYLADEYVAEAGSIPSMTANDPRVEAMQLLMAANRRVYLSCSVIPSFGERLRRTLLRWSREAR